MYEVNILVFLSINTQNLKLKIYITVHPKLVSKKKTLNFNLLFYTSIFFFCLLQINIIDF